MTERTPDQPDTEPRAKLLDLSLTQLIGGSLAAMTAAALGSRLGVVGTLAGAAVGSVVTAIAASLYTNSMARAHRAIVTTWRPGEAAPRLVAVSELPATRTVPHDSAARARATPRRRIVRGTLVSATAVFLLAAAFLGGLQLATGTSVTGTDLGTRQEAARPADQPGAGQPAGQEPVDEVGATVEPAPTTTIPEPTLGPSPTETGTPAPRLPVQVPRPTRPSRLRRPVRRRPRSRPSLQADRGRSPWDQGANRVPFETEVNCAVG